MSSLQIDTTSSKKRNMQKVRAEELESRFKSKRAIYQYLIIQW